MRRTRQKSLVPRFAPSFGAKAGKLKGQPSVLVSEHEFAGCGKTHFDRHCIGARPRACAERSRTGADKAKRMSRASSPAMLRLTKPLPFREAPRQGSAESVLTANFRNQLNGCAQALTALVHCSALSIGAWHLRGPANKPFAVAFNDRCELVPHEKSIALKPSLSMGEGPPCPSFQLERIVSAVSEFT